MGIDGQLGCKILVGEPNVFEPGAGKDHDKEKNLHPVARRVPHVVFAKIHLCLFSVGGFFHHLVFTGRLYEGQVVPAPYPENKIENGLLGNFWKVNKMLLQLVVHLGGRVVLEFFQAGLHKIS
ncbi:MAG: hypothetical protein WD426_06910 [Anditalea sp.]